ncbi:type I-E CRISPR-associated protein Cas7/Cse4/CasC [Cronobacter sakazakii]|uniref:type I-E CRISPR-associated protein Cas7/Cse4/CasC n=1 Tax=Cronobacter sakazakii TaxID=28141 RepID=UPI000CFAF4A6|nr:type I-E CRISPR-associated protein Cas7/Cse4/CasC [Cronobacter sakazakii]
MQNFINFHVLISHSPSCLNRDDINMQKEAIFGGKRRVRISSQSLKRAFRKSDYYEEHLGQGSIRTRKPALLLNELVSLGGFNDSKKIWLEKSINAIANFSGEESDSEKDDNPEQKKENKKIAVAPWCVEEILFISDIVERLYQEPLTEKEKDSLSKKIEAEKRRKATKDKPKKSESEIRDGFYLDKIKKEISTNLSALQSAIGNAVDIALSGRMATSGLMTNVTGALSVAHAITTHSVQSDLDWFTAVDDLNANGSGHLDTQEFSSGVFYRYACLNIAQLQENLGNASREKALEIAAHLAHLLATEVPGAKQRTFAAFNPADMVLVNFSDFPLSMANAFEQPVKAQEGYIKPSLEAFKNYWERVTKAYGLTGPAAQFNLYDVELPARVQPHESLESLKTWIRQNGEG